MTDLIAEFRLSLAELARRESVAVSTVWRWALRGVRGVRLETFSVGAKRFTTREAFGRFVKATTAASQRNGKILSPLQLDRQRAAEISQAERELDAPIKRPRRGIGK